MIARLSFKSFSNTTKLLAMGALLVTVGGAFAACSAGSDEEGDMNGAGYSDQNRLPYTQITCPGRGCK